MHIWPLKCNAQMNTLNYILFGNDKNKTKDVDYNEPV